MFRVSPFFCLTRLFFIGTAAAALVAFGQLADVRYGYDIRCRQSYNVYI